MQKNHYLVIDTETVNGIKREDNTVDLSQSLVYDVGWCICDKKGNVLLTRSFIVREIFTDYPDLMKSGYYADKLVQYYADIKDGKRQIENILTIWQYFLDDCRMYTVKAVMAYNAYFDYRALSNTIRYVTKSKFRTFFPKKYEIWDILKMTNSILPKRKSYISFCQENGYLTKHKTPRPQMKAETVYKYIKPHCQDFVESHTVIEDALIETEIFAYCMRQKKKMNKTLFTEKG